MTDRPGNTADPGRAVSRMQRAALPRWARLPAQPDRRPGSARLFSIYANPQATAMRRFVLQEWVLLPVGRVKLGIAWYASSLHGARARLPAGVGYRIGRTGDDGPALVESWL